MARDTAGAHDVGVAVHPGTRLGVVVIQGERVSLGRLQEVDDLAVLVSALRQPLLLGLAGKRGFPAAPGTGRRWHRCGAGLRVADGPQYERRLAGTRMHEADRDASVRLRENLRRNIQADDLVS